MRSDPVVSSVGCVVFILLLSWLCQLWRGTTAAPTSPTPPRATREPKPFAGLTRKPACALCTPDSVSTPLAPRAPPPRRICTRGRRRQIETTGHFCPYAGCSYYGWVGVGHLRANGHPHGRHWRQLVCRSGPGDFLETVDTPCHAKQGDPDKLVWAMTALAAGRGIRAVARVFETDPNTVRTWLVEAAEHLAAFSHHYVREVYVEQGQMDALFAWLSSVKDG